MKLTCTQRDWPCFCMQHATADVCCSRRSMGMVMQTWSKLKLELGQSRPERIIGLLGSCMVNQTWRM